MRHDCFYFEKSPLHHSWSRKCLTRCHINFRDPFLCHKSIGKSNCILQNWNSYLADMSAEWAGACDFNHGQPTRNASTKPYNQIGQNLYLTSSNSIDLAKAIQAWYYEISYYTYETRACSLVCGHYTQVGEGNRLVLKCTCICKCKCKCGICICTCT